MRSASDGSQGEAIRPLIRPLILIGTGRCGSTLVHRMLACHPRLAWLSQVSDRYPDRPKRTRLALRLLDLPGARSLLNTVLDPSEAYLFWEHYCPGFSSPFRDLTEADLRPHSREMLRNALSSVVTRRRARLLIKLTGWPRVGFLRSLFPDALFVHVHRDGRAVASSFLNVRWWTGWSGPANWKWGDLTPDQQERWERSGRSFVVLAGLEWELLMSAHGKALGGLAAEDYVEISYESLCAQPVESVRRIIEFAGVEWTDSFAADMRRFSIHSTSDKWMNHLSLTQRRQLEEAIRGSLAEYGYV